MIVINDKVHKRFMNIQTSQPTDFCRQINILFSCFRDICLEGKQSYLYIEDNSIHATP